MNDRHLKELLHHASGVEPADPVIDAHTVRQAVIHRTAIQRRAAAALLVTISAAITIAILFQGGGHTPDKVVKDGSGGLKGQVADMGTTSIHERIAMEAQMMLDRRRAAALARTDGIDLAEQRSQAARTMVLVAERRAELAGKQEAAALYTRTITMFPETDSAVSARLALGKLERPN